ncbi:tetratricopeptide repeat protein [Meiothermus sp.]|uniref:ATP-binding protein n=1 Tax=Meiothermus sp. TaxID=1955249 RepID=UPI0021DE0AF3|nr:tetratricopeptide repeat protein [Meiothermus sp.]GIW33531.1 MAG: transcriptional activator [Meiothermus sp.]
MDVRLCLLGTPRLETASTTSDLPLDRPASLGYYLAVRGDWVRRSEMAYLYSPEADEASALSNLRKLVHRLRQQGWAEALEADAHRLRLPLPTDMQEFRSALECRDWQAALACYRGTFLEGLAFPDLSGYGAWLELERQDLARAWRMAVHEQVRVLESQTDWPQAERWLSRLLAADPLDEEAVQALMRVLHRAGKPAQAQGVFERFRRSLKAELGVGPLEATRALADSLLNAGTAVPIETAPLKHNLPTSSTRFIGRRRELRTLAQHLANPDCRLLTLVGLGGMGKTRLALELAAQQVKCFPEGVWLVALEGVASPEQLVSSIAGALNFTFAGPTDPKLQLLLYLRSKALLLLLDNFEHLLEGAPLLEELLSQAPGLKLLVTSRVALELPNEWLFDLEGLSYPPPQTEEDLDGFDAVRLFIAQAERLSNRFVLTPAALEAIAELTRRVQGMPLALELLATWVRGLSVNEILTQLGRSFELLQTPRRDLPERHRSLEAILDYSWRLLSEAEQGVLARLSVFRGGFTLEAAQIVAGAHLGLLLRFINQSLVQRGEDRRYAMHELVRQFAEKQLNEGEKTKVYALFGDYFLYQLLDLGTAVRTSIQRNTVTRCRQELSNIFFVLDYLAVTGDTLRLNRALLSLYAILEITGLFKDGIAKIEDMAAALKARGSNDETLQAELEAIKGYFLFRIGRDEEAKHYAESAVAYLKTFSPSDYLGIAYCAGALCNHFAGRFEEAQDWYSRALTVFETVGNRSEQCRVLNRLAALLKQLERYDQSNRLYRQALEIAVEVGDLSEQGNLLNNYAINFESTGQVEEAIRMYQSSLEICERIGYLRGQSAALTNLGHVHERKGEFLEARKYYEQSLHIKQTLGEPVAMAISMINLADVLYALGQEAAAHRINFQVIDLTLEVHAMIYTARSFWSFCKFFERKGLLENGLILACFLSKTRECEQWVRDEADEMIARYAEVAGKSELDRFRAQVKDMDYWAATAWLKRQGSLRAAAVNTL